jgi:hypothetical protein
MMRGYFVNRLAASSSHTGLAAAYRRSALPDAVPYLFDIHTMSYSIPHVSWDIRSYIRGGGI